MLSAHVTLMLFYALLAGLFFALLWRTETKERVRLFLTVFVSLMMGGLALAWIMYPFPLR